MFKRFLFLLISALFLAPSSVWGAPNITTAQNEVDRLRSVAADKYEAANQATIQIAELERQTKSLRQQDLILKSNLSQSMKILGKIAVDRYKGSGLGQGFDLLLSSDPSRYLSDAAALNVVTARYAVQMREFTVAKQKVQSSQYLISDRVALLKDQKTKLNLEVAAANASLTQATKLLNSLKKGDRQRLLKAEAARESKIFRQSTKLASNYIGDKSRGSIALKFALKQIGDIYVWGAAGPTKWDCSGLTLRAFQQSGVSLPHSAAIQFRYGKPISYESVKPGDLLFFGNPISHVSIYMGNGKMVQAPRPGKKVEVVPLTRKFGYKYFVGAKRL